MTMLRCLQMSRQALLQRSMRSKTNVQHHPSRCHRDVQVGLEALLIRFQEEQRALTDLRMLHESPPNQMRQLYKRRMHPLGTAAELLRLFRLELARKKCCLNGRSPPSSTLLLYQFGYILLRRLGLLLNQHLGLLEP